MLYIAFLDSYFWYLVLLVFVLIGIWSYSAGVDVGAGVLFIDVFTGVFIGVSTDVPTDVSTDVFTDICTGIFPDVFTSDVFDDS